MILPYIHSSVSFFYEVYNCFAVFSMVTAYFLTLVFFLKSKLYLECVIFLLFIHSKTFLILNHNKKLPFNITFNSYV